MTDPKKFDPAWDGGARILVAIVLFVALISFVSFVRNGCQPPEDIDYERVGK